MNESEAFRFLDQLEKSQQRDPAAVSSQLVKLIEILVEAKKRPTWAAVRRKADRIGNNYVDSNVF